MLDLATDQDTPASCRGGPRTAEGKARSSRNAVRHGLNCPPPYDPDQEAQTAACSDWFADGDPRLLEPARAAAEAWAWLQRIRAVRAERVWAPLVRLESIEAFDPEVVSEAMSAAVRELQAIDRYERRARAAYHRSLEELDAARMRLVRAPLTPSTSEPPRVRERAERLAWWEVADPARAVARCLAESGYVVGGRAGDWLGRDWVWEWELAAEDADAEGTGSLSVTPASADGSATPDRVPVPVAARDDAACATDRAERTDPLNNDRHSGQAALARGADPEPSSSAIDEGRAATSAALTGSRIGAPDAAPSGMTGNDDERVAAADRAERTHVARAAAARAATGTGTLSATSPASAVAGFTDRDPVPSDRAERTGGPPRRPRPTLTNEQRERFRAHLAELAKRTDLWRRAP